MPVKRRDRRPGEWFGVALLVLGAALVGNRAWGQTDPTGQTREKVALEGLSVLMESDGLPGRPHFDETPQERLSRQRLLVTGDRLRLQDSRSGVTFLLRLDLDPPTIWELSADLSQYSEVKKGEELQAGRDRWEHQEIQKWREKLSRAEFEKFLKENHLHEDGTREVTIQVDDAAGKLLGHPVKRYRIRENGRVVVDVKVTDALQISIPFFDFYRRLGAFSSQVLDKLQEIKGVPLEATLTVVTDVLNYEIHTVVRDVQKHELDPNYFELPPGAREVDEERQVVECTRQGCKNSVEIASPPAKYIFNLTTYYFCSMECRKKWYKEELLPVIQGRAKGKATKASDSKTRK